MSKGALVENVATVRVVLQRVTRASLLIDNVSQRVAIGSGVVCYVAFLAQATPSTAAAAAVSLVSAKIFNFPSVQPSTSSTDESAAASPDGIASLLDSPLSSILIVPQASLGGKLKGKAVQYHGLVPKDTGVEVYASFCAMVRQCLSSPGPSSALDAVSTPGTLRVQCGTYGNRQALDFESEGPNTHFFDL
mgnify:FL=1